MTNEQIIAMMNEKLVGMLGVAMFDSRPIALGTFKSARKKDVGNIVLEFSHKSVGIFLPMMMISTIKRELEQDGYEADLICDSLFVGDRNLSDVVGEWLDENEKNPSLAVDSQNP